MEFTKAGVMRTACWWRSGGMALLGCFTLAIFLDGRHANAQTSGNASTTRGVSAQVTPNKIRAGGYAVYTVTVEGGVASEIIEPQLPDGVEMAGAGKSTSSGTQIINGRVTRSYSQSWQITAPQSGTYTIPPQQVEVDGKVAQTNAVQLIVADRDDSELTQYDPLLSIEVGKREFYEGEKVPLTASLYVHRQTILRRVGLIELPKDNFAIQRFPLQGEEGIARVGGVPYRVMTFQSTMSGLKPGKYKLGPATSEVIVEIPTADNPFPHPLFSQSEPQKLKPKSNDIEVNVLALPSQGKPKSFNGVVGDFTIHLNADPHELSVGEPISVEITIEGSGNFDAIVSPALTGSASDWKVYPAKRFNMGTKDVMVGEIVNQVGFSQVIIPQKPVTEVPSYEFSFFSPTKKEYVTLRTPPVPLKVKPSSVPPAPLMDASSSSELAKPQTPDKVPQASLSMTDILSMTSETPVWLAVKPLPWKDTRVMLGSAAAGGLLMLLLLGKAGAVMLHRRRTSSQLVGRELWRRLHEKRSPAADFYAAAAKWIRLKGLQGERLHEVLEKAEALNYGREANENASAMIDRREQKQIIQLLTEAERTTDVQG